MLYTKKVEYAQGNGGGGWGGNTQYGSDANNLSNWGTVAAMWGSFLTGYNLPIPGGFHFTNDAVAGAFRNAAGIIQARNDFYNTGKTHDVVPFGLEGLLNAGYDPVEQFVGGYNYQIDVIGNSLQFTITNTTSFASGAYHLWPYSWNWHSGPMGNQNQTYIFTEPIRK